MQTSQCFTLTQEWDDNNIICLNYVTVCFFVLNYVCENNLNLALNNYVMKCTFVLVEISDLSDNYLKMALLCSNYKWGILENKRIYV